MMKDDCGASGKSSSGLPRSESKVCVLISLLGFFSSFGRCGLTILYITGF